MTTSWSEGGSTWNDSDNEASPAIPWAGGGAFGSADYDTKIYATLPVLKQPYTIEAKELVEDWIALGNQGLGLIALPESGGDGEWFSREEGDETRRPLLDVIYLKRVEGSCGSQSGGDAFVATGDTYVAQKSGDQAKNYGGEDEIKIRTTTISENKYGLLQFSTDFIPEEAVITKATLEFTTNSNAERPTGCLRDEIGDRLGGAGGQLMMSGMAPTLGPRVISAPVTSRPSTLPIPMAPKRQFRSLQLPLPSWCGTGTAAPRRTTAWPWFPSGAIPVKSRSLPGIKGTENHPS